MPKYHWSLSDCLCVQLLIKPLKTTYISYILAWRHFWMALWENISKLCVPEVFSFICWVWFIHGQGIDPVSTVHGHASKTTGKNEMFLKRIVREIPKWLESNMETSFGKLFNRQKRFQKYLIFDHYSMAQTNYGSLFNSNCIWLYRAFSVLRSNYLICSQIIWFWINLNKYPGPPLACPTGRIKAATPHRNTEKEYMRIQITLTQHLNFKRVWSFGENFLVKL